ncbi:tetrathionate reductase subunit A [Brevirhabdus pacifica]|uniref:Tetrathionate reductase subunit A n=1 Tax=Brevirhabdus pacifica TaxID=1267768 RepID=A0A1U7DGH1_9RHOB|nr:molybdopterin dinucleotide binding domain-containing protein [Brevirhabdus pacifica]APX89061.1 tetrathionate reductase subunit A [Brevirhabdus pacifica]OWU80268.1 tetrathionate reductase subunit A [Loktanella sp. 22II-4b]PJJ86362.1 tetrathionate reductase alpha subunit precursor [Brevirhabdus pacifica]
MDKSRRRLLKVAAAAGGAATFAAGYAEPLEKLAHGLSGSAGEKPAHPVYGNAPKPEYSVDLKTGALTPNAEQRMAFTVCYGCTTKCGVRVRIDNATDRVIRVAGNPYNPLSADRHLDHATPVREALRCVSAFGEAGQINRSTACARGNAMIGQIDSPHRVLKVLKRAGKRGEGRWTSVPFEQAIEEICEGGDLFGEGPVEGLRAINDYETPIDPENPEFGPLSNQLLVMEATDYGRSALLKRFAFNAFGTRNYGHHGSYCGLAFRMGSGAVMNDMAKFAHTKPDFANAAFGLFIGSAPSQSGNPFKRQGRLLAEARARGTLDYVVVDPALNASVVESAGAHSNWVPVRPGTDSALAMGLIRWLLENDGYAAEFLALPSASAADAAGEVGHTNASHLVIVQADHPRQGHFLRRSDLGEVAPGAEGDLPMVFDHGKLLSAEASSRGDLFADETLVLPDGGRIAVKSSLMLLREAALEYSMDEYAEACGVPHERIAAIAARFKAGGRRAVADCHGGMMSASGFYATFAVQLMNLLAGSINHAGGSAHGGGSFNGTGKGPRYDLATFPEMRKPKGIFLSRSKFPYEKSSEFKRRVAAGEDPYPATAPWRSLAPPTLSEHLASALDGYPYPIKALIGCMANPIYGQAGLDALIGERLRDPARLGLYVAVDGFINETNRYADYIFPDSVMYEVWGFTGAWSGNLTKMTTACWPVVAPRQVKTADGQPVSMESFFIALAKRLGLAGFGEGAIPSADGALWPLNTAEDFFLRAGANIAFMGEPLPPVTDDDAELSGLASLLPRIEAVLPEQERGPVAYLYARGGRFQTYDGAHDGERLGNRWKRTFCIYNEEVGTAIDSQTGRRHSGVPGLRVARLADGTPMRDRFPEAEWPLLAFSFKSNLMNPYAAGLDRLRMIKPYNPVLMNDRDAALMGIGHGDLVRIESPGGHVIGMALVSRGVMRGALGIEHGFGHRELGAARHSIDGQDHGGNPWVGAGVNLNDLGFADPTRRVPGTWLEPISGAAVRQGLPVRVSLHESAPA